MAETELTPTVPVLDTATYRRRLRLCVMGAVLLSFPAGIALGVAATAGNASRAVEVARSVAAESMGEARAEAATASAELRDSRLDLRRVEDELRGCRRDLRRAGDGR